jgi:hypothetical protein
VVQAAACKAVYPGSNPGAASSLTDRIGRGLQSPVRRFDSARRLFLFVQVGGIAEENASLGVPARYRGYTAAPHGR